MSTEGIDQHVIEMGSEELKDYIRKVIDYMDAAFLPITIEVVLNDCYGGFGLSEEGNKRLKEMGFIYDETEDFRKNPLLISLCREGDPKYFGKFCMPVIRTVALSPSQDIRINEYDGLETLEIRSIF